MRDPRSKWMKQVRKLAGDVGMDLSRIGVEDASMIREMVDDWDADRWREEMRIKSSLEYYNRYKNEIGGIDFYDNSYGSVLLFRCRSNTIRVNSRKRIEGGDGRCGLCEGNEETVKHFLVECAALEEVRRRHERVSRGNMEEILMFVGDGNNVRGVFRFLEDMWKTRRLKLASDD